MWSPQLDRLQLCREEVLAYMEAVHRIQKGKKFLLQGLHTRDLPAPELCTEQPTDRVQHYMEKLNKYILAEPQLKRKYECAAVTIQSVFKRYKWKKMITRVQQKVASFHHALGGSLMGTCAHDETSYLTRLFHMQLREMHNTQRMFQSGIPLDEHSVDQLLQIKMGHAKCQPSTLPMSDTQLRRVSVLHFARQVSGTGLGKVPKSPFTGDSAWRTRAISNLQGTQQHLLQPPCDTQNFALRAGLSKPAEVTLAPPSVINAGAECSLKHEETGDSKVHLATGSIKQTSMAALEEKMDRMMDSIVDITQELQVLKGAVLCTHYEAATANCVI